jgi:hypothetical protein
MSKNEPDGSAPELPFGLDFFEIETALAGERDSRICSCGHPVSQHDVLEGSVSGCFPPRAECLCREPLPVVEVSNKRFFLKTTRGWGERHALSTGLFALARSGGKSKSLVGKVCFKCGEEVAKLIPTSLNEASFILEEPGVSNPLLCLDCWSQFPIKYRKNW